jgi:hypothetical protein
MKWQGQQPYASIFSDCEYVRLSGGMCHRESMHTLSDVHPIFFPSFFQEKVVPVIRKFAICISARTNDGPCELAPFRTSAPRRI